MFNSGQVSKLDFDSVQSCIIAKQELQREMPEKSGYVTCLINEGR